MIRNIKRRTYDSQNRTDYRGSYRYRKSHSAAVCAERISGCRQLPNSSKKRRRTATSGEHFCQQADLTNLQQVQQLVTAVQKQYGTIDILINNAGIALKQDVVTTASCEDFNRLFNVNMKGPFLCTNEVLPGMIRQKRGSIVNIASIWGVCGASCEVLYSASKAAVIGYTKALAKEVGPSGIRVNAIAPGLIDTEMNQHLSDLDKQTFAQELPLERIGTPQDVAEAVFFLAGDHAGYITGQVLNVDGGYQI